jgi:hypothetical protein
MKTLESHPRAEAMKKLKWIGVPFNEEKFAGWEGRFTPACVGNTQPQIVSAGMVGSGQETKTHIRLERSESAGVNRPSQPANFRMLISIQDRS